jgi:hypothetical protein
LSEFLRIEVFHDRYGELAGSFGEVAEFSHSDLFFFFEVLLEISPDAFERVAGQVKRVIDANNCVLPGKKFQQISCLFFGNVKKRRKVFPGRRLGAAF